MVFSSLIFLFRFLPLVLLLYYLVPTKCRNAVLLATSLIFYAWGEQGYVLIMVFSTIINYAFGILIDYLKKRNSMTKAKVTMILSVITNLSILCYFKYADMIIRGINNIFSNTELDMLKVALPIGISFYTFQTMSYTIDIYRGNVKVQKNIISFAAYVTMFPQLIAGPIVRYGSIEKDLRYRKETEALFAEGIGRFITGLGKKVLIANNVGILWSQIQNMNMDNMPVITAWIGILAYTFQIYFDFSGYSDMAIGLGKMFGFNFDENFNYPYISKSVTEFWRRWHISLSTWFKEYVYIPLGGNRGSVYKHIRNIMAVWILTGLWHGANINFIMWGLYYGIILITEKFVLKPIYRKIFSDKNNRENILISAMRHIYSTIIIIFGWVIFSFNSVNSVKEYTKSMLGINRGIINLYNRNTVYLLYTNIILLSIAAFGATPIPARVVKYIGNKINSDIIKVIIKNLFYITIFILSVAYIVDSTYNPFLYFKF